MFDLDVVIDSIIEYLLGKDKTFNGKYDYNIKSIDKNIGLNVKLDIAKKNLDINIHI